MESVNYRLNTVIETQEEISRLGFNLNSVIELVARRAQEVSYADGANVEIVEDDEIVYQGVSGMTAAYLKFRVKQSECISGLCLATGQTLYCADVEFDERVNQVQCLQFGLRSILATPLWLPDRQVVGVLKVFSKKVNAFNEQDINTIQLMAGLLGLAIGHVQAVEAINQALIADLAHYEQLTADLQAQLVKEKDLNRKTGLLISQLSHDFRTPLTAIQTSAELLQFYSDKFSQAKKDEIHERIQGSIRQIIERLDDTLQAVQPHIKKP